MAAFFFSFLRMLILFHPPANGGMKLPGCSQCSQPLPEPFISKASVPVKDPIITTDSSNCIIPFSRAGNLIVIRAKIDTITGNFILDTGAPGLVLNMTYFRNYTAVDHTDDIQGGVTGATENGGHTNIDSLSFGPVRYYSIDADRINLGHLENTRGIKIHGLLGMQLFKQFEMIMDYEKNLIYLHLITRKDPRDYKHEMLKDTSAYIESSIDFIENKLITYVYSGGKKLSFIVDTGAETNLIDSRLPSKVLDGIVINKRVFLNGTGSAKVEALSGNINTIKIGNYNVANLPIIVTNLEKLCFAYDRCLDGMLGFDFLSQQKIGFNFVKRKMYIWK